MTEYNFVGAIILAVFFSYAGYYLYKKAKKSERYRKHLRICSIISFIVVGVFISDIIYYGYFVGSDHLASIDLEAHPDGDSNITTSIFGGDTSYHISLLNGERTWFDVTMRYQNSTNKSHLEPFKFNNDTNVVHVIVDRHGSVFRFTFDGYIYQNDNDVPETSFILTKLSYNENRFMFGTDGYIVINFHYGY
jgi:hypothetical protein